MNDEIVLHIIQAILVVTMIAFITLVVVVTRRQKANPFAKFGLGVIIGFITDLGDTLGVGSFATTSALFRLTKFSDDDTKLPGTLNAAHAIPVMVEALLFITTVKIELTTLVPMTMAAMLGAYVGPHITRRWNARLVRVALGSALVIAAVIIIIRTFTNPGVTNPASVHGLHGILLPVGLIFNFILGNLMTIGLGNYAPELIFFSLVGVNPSVAFPVMMLDAAMIMSVSGSQFVMMNRVQWKGLAGIAIGGIVGVVVAVTVVKQLPLSWLNWLIVTIALWTAFTLFRDGLKPSNDLAGDKY
ncbi:sodium:solute symporter [Periweissella cryptocerci]|uniref:Probable membrane transporter protein n=1 Tax=Periweissella cryptocerci TaxID=2506420 RepID=A0A4P6YTI9_9LACO|nr:TSUP family transporter [Periweissella cryptocerci]QBO36002.1 sodium:solute symporter [Periweissella cryptocerci]